MPNLTYYVLSLGCAKNSVDSESMAHLLTQEGYARVNAPAHADVLIVNTCAFIADARDESLKELSKLAGRKNKHQALIATGCLSQRFGAHLIEMIPGLDGILGTQHWMQIVELIRRLRAGGKRPLLISSSNPTYPGFPPGVPQHAIQGGSAYLKIADGCSHACSFCAIPLIKGKSRSRPVESILNDARQLQSRGVKEIILIAQDTTDYGRDLGMQEGLAQLLDALVPACPDVPWIRIMYAYPGLISSRLIDRMAESPQILPYIDLPLQHANPAILKSMKRPFDMDWVYSTIDRLRRRMPEIAMRSTFIVGYPGETEREFEDLLAFVQEVRFDRIGAFPFSFEEGSPSASLGDPVPPQVKLERLERLMELQQPISLMLNQNWVGTTMDVLVEGRQKDLVIARTFRDAPEIDGLVIAEGKCRVGEMGRVKITGAMEYDLSGIIIH